MNPESLLSGVSGSISDKDGRDCIGGAPRLQAYLFKRGELNKLWKKRYFVLSNCMLIWYRQKEDVKAASSIMLENCTALALSEKQLGRKFCFQIVSTKFKRSYNIQAESYAERARWIDSINKASEFFNQRSDVQTSRVSVKEKENDTQYESEYMEEGFGELRLQKSIENLPISELQKLYVFTEEDRRKACISSRYSLWRQKLAFDGISSSRDHLFHYHHLPEKEYSKNAFGFTMSNSMDVMAVSQCQGFQESAIQFVKKEVTGLSSQNTIQQPEGSTCLSWVNDILISGSVSGKVYAYKVKPLDLRANFAPVSIFTNHIDSIGRSPPGRWIKQSRNGFVKIDPVSGDRFLTAVNHTVHLYDIASAHSPISSVSLTNLPNAVSCEWAGHSPDLFMVGDITGSLKLYDSRSSSKKSKSIWKVNEAHSGAVGCISWNGLMRNWFASGGDDGTVKVWDIRGTGDVKTPFRMLNSSPDAISCIDWSNSHCEKLVSGCADGSVKLWNLRVVPHHVCHTHKNLQGRAVGVAFSPTQPSLYYGVSDQGQVFSAKMTNAFLKPFVQNRFEEEEDRGDLAEEEKRIEELIYFRDFEKAYENLAIVSRKLWKNRNDESSRKRLAQLVTLSSSTMFDSFSKNVPSRYSRLLRELSYYVSPLALRSTHVLESSQSEILLLRLRLALVKLIEDKKYIDILSLENDICSHLQRDIDAIDMVTFKHMLLVILPNEYLNGLRFSIRVAHILRDQKRFNDFVDVAEMLFYPTIYHNQGQTTFKMETALAKKATNNLDRDLRNPKLVISQLELLYNVNAPLTFPDSSSLIIDSMEGQMKALPANLHRIYFNILIDQKLYDKFFILATSVSQPLIGYDFHNILTIMMEEVAFPQLKSFIEEYSIPDPNAPWEVSRFIAASLTVVNIVENCVYLPNCLEDTLPDYLRILTERLREGFKQMCENPDYISSRGFTKGGGILDAKIQVDNILNQITKIRELKRSNTVFFENLVVDFVQMLQTLKSI